MKRTRVLFSGFIGIVVLLAVACGSSATSTPAATTQPTDTSEATSAPTSPAETLTATTAAGETPTNGAEETPTTPDNGGNGDLQAGQEVFLTAAVPCSTCHTIEGVTTTPASIGPELTHIASVAETRVEGQSAEEYIHESIVDPSAFVVEGYAAGLMPPNFEETLSSEQIDDLVAFLLTLE